METIEYHGSAYRVWSGAEIGPDHVWFSHVSREAWYWEPTIYDGDVVYSNPYEDREEASWAAEAAHDNGDWK